MFIPYQLHVSSRPSKFCKLFLMKAGTKPNFETRITVEAQEYLEKDFQTRILRARPPGAPRMAFPTVWAKSESDDLPIFTWRAVTHYFSGS
jgi:hypothetical protein